MHVRLFSLLAVVLAPTSLLCFAGFLQNLTFQTIEVPFHPWAGWVTNCASLLAFALVHSVVAHPPKKRLLGAVDARLERIIYQLIFAAQLAVLAHFWKPFPAAVWQLDSRMAIGVANAAFYVGLALLLLSTVVIELWHLLGLRQAFIEQPALQGTSVRSPYRLVRYAFQTGLVLALWATPLMTADHLVLAAFLSFYGVLATIGLGEREWSAQLGREYTSLRLINDE